MDTEAEPQWKHEPDDELDMDPEERDLWLAEHIDDPPPAIEVVVETDE